MDLSEKAPVEFPVYKTMLGSITMRSSRGKAELGGEVLAAEILTPIYGPGKNLVGMRLLSEFTTLLHRAEMSCIGDRPLTADLLWALRVARKGLTLMAVAGVYSIPR